MSRVTQSEMIEVFRVDGGLSTMVGCNRKIGEKHETYIEDSEWHGASLFRITTCSGWII